MAKTLAALLCAALLVVSAAPPCVAARARRPDIIFIITDDQRWDSLGATGHPFAKTPNIDRLAREGALFRNFFTTTPLCSPSRASFLTGRYAHSHLVTNNDRLGLDVISHTLMTFPRRLRESGYETAFVGKWHMGLDDSRRPGFDHWVSFKGQGIYLDPVLNVDGRQLQLDGHMTDLLNRRALEFVSRPHAKPFMLYLSHKALHTPYLPAKRHESLYSNARYVPPPSADEDLAGKPVLRRAVEPVDWTTLEGVAPEPPESRRGRGTDRDSVVRDQLRTLAAVDEGVGMLLRALKKSGRLDDTVVVFTADNGYLLGEHGQFDNKRFAYDESIRVPFLVRYPKLIAPGTTVDALALNVDVAPTLLALAGAEPLEAVHGRSLLPLLRGRAEGWRESFLAEYFLEKVAPRAPSWQAVRTARWKYIRYTGPEGMDELYDLAADPHEMRNLVGEPAARTALDEMKAELERLKQASR
ncbi:MAG TPA: sulfatase [Pyrinomonadaceae bacterium]|jgi:N-acetylglucosamine-6-sulfatase|nr:sulfatase [Pyrinomonadaceae bacterium]